MAGEYYRWLAKDVKPEEKRELTKEEKIQNWWYYHKWHVLIAVVALFLVADFVGDILRERRNQPDYSVAYVGSSYLPDDTVEQLKAALAELGEDLNGNGKVQVAVHQYIAYSASGNVANSNDYSALYGAQVQLVADISNCDSFIFLLEDPRQFQTDYPVLIHMDGTFPETEEPSEKMYRSWTQCPVLAGLPLGEYTLETLEKIYTGTSQDILQGLYVARRGFWEGENCENYEGNEALWNRLIQGAEN